MHVFPQLRKLELNYQNELAVIGVHSPKFPNERDTDCIRMAIERYEVSHPVINDEQFEIWNSYACRAWPTLMFIDPLGKVVGKHEGEASFEALGLITFFTVGPKETHAWAVREGANAETGAGAIHSDLQRGFIRAEIASYKDFVESNGCH